MTTSGFKGAIFDVDGVLVNSPHERAWQDSLAELMLGDWAGIRDQTTWSTESFTPHVYQQVMSGKPRMSGALAALEYFKVPQASQRATEYAARKQDMVIKLINAGEFEAYPDALRFVLAVRDAGILVAAASSSKNAGLFLRQIRLDKFAAQQSLPYEVPPGLTLLGSFDADRAAQVVDLGQVDDVDVLCAVVVLDLAARPIDALDSELRAGLHPRDDGDVRMPAVVNDVVLGGCRGQINLDERFHGFFSWRFARSKAAGRVILR